MDQLSPNHPDHPSNQLHDAAYPMADYQPSNLVPHHNPSGGASSSSSSSIPAQPSSPGAAKYTEIATPALALTSGQASSSWHPAGPSHLDTALDPPPSYEQSQSHSTSRPGTSSQQPSASNLSIVPPAAGGAPSPNSPNASINSTTPLRPTPAYHQPGQPAGPSPYAYGPPPPNSGPGYGGGGGGMAGYKPPPMGYQSRFDNLRRRSWFVSFLLMGLFLLALFVGLMIGFRGKFDDNDDEKDSRGPRPDDFPTTSTLSFFHPTFGSSKD